MAGDIINTNSHNPVFPPRHLWRGGGRQAGGEVKSKDQPKCSHFTISFKIYARHRSTPNKPAASSKHSSCAGSASHPSMMSLADGYGAISPKPSGSMRTIWASISCSKCATASFGPYNANSTAVARASPKATCRIFSATRERCLPHPLPTTNPIAKRSPFRASYGSIPMPFGTKMPKNSSTGAKTLRV